MPRPLAPAASAPDLPVDPRTVAAVRERLVGWFDANARDLPWRRTRDPYAVWVSEIMLQQTRVDTVVPYYERFLARFPTVGSLADAPEDDVLGLWQGLGYYSRARNLHRAAQAVAARHHGRLPADAGALRALPGIGRYTAGAIASIAHDLPEPILDGNVARVLARLFDVAGDPRAPGPAARLWALAEALVPPAGSPPAPTPGRFNQALMELGALVCAPVEPRCLLCPVRAQCRAHAAGRQHQVGGPRSRPAPARVTRLVAVVERRGRLLFLRRAEGLLRGLWEMPGLDGRAGGPPPSIEAFTAFARGACALSLELDPSPLGEVEHLFTHRRMTARLHRARPRAGRVRAAAPYDAARWLSPAAAAGGAPLAVPLSRLMRRALALVRGGAE